MKRKNTVTIVLAGLLGMAAAAQALEPIALSVGNFRPLEAETAKFLTPVKQDPTAVAGTRTELTAEDRKYLSAEELGAIRRDEVQEKIFERRKAIRAVEEANAKREEEIERLRQAMLGEPEMRPLFSAGKKLSAKLSQYGEFRIMERNDMAELLQEAGGESGARSAATFAAARKAGAFMVYVDVGDLRRNTHQGSVGGVDFKDTEYVRDFILKLQDIEDGTIALSRTIPIKKTHTVTSVGGTVSETIFDEMVDEAVDKIADAIYQNFMAEVTFALKVAPNNPELDPGMLAVEIYDETGQEMLDSASDGSTVTLRKGKYILKCQDPYTYLFMDNKDRKGPVVYSASKTETQMFQGAMQDVEFTFNDPDGNFPEVTLVPVGGDGEAIPVYAGPNTVRKGVYELNAHLDGYRDLKRQQAITSMTKTIPIQMMKAPAGVPGI
jgi:hypothetical protein